VGDEGAHAELVSERQRLAVVFLGRLGIRRIAMGGDRTEKVKTPCLVAALTVLAGQREPSSGSSERFLGPVGEQVRLAKLHEDERVVGSQPDGLDGVPRLRQHRKPLSDTP
jgi:hypothetical protein